MRMISCLSLVIFAFLCALFVSPLFAAENSQASGPPPTESTLEKNKAEILRDIDLFEESLHRAKGCISEAKTPEQIQSCREEETVRKFQQVQDKLNEIGMSRDERRMHELRRGLYP